MSLSECIGALALTGPLLSHLKCFGKLCPAWEAEAATGAGTKEVLFCDQWPGSAFCFHVCSEKATFRSGKFLKRIIQDASIKMSLLFAFWEKREDRVGHSPRVHP